MMLKSLELLHCLHWNQWDVFAVEIVTSMEVEDNRTREKKDLYKTWLIILCFSVLMGPFFHSWWEFCLLWNISKSSPTPPFPGRWACRWSEITFQGQFHRRNWEEFLSNVSPVLRGIMHSAFFGYIALWLTIIYICKLSLFLPF